MVLKSNKAQTHLCIYITPHAVRSCIIEKKIVGQLFLKEFVVHTIDNLSLEKLILFNPIHIQSLLVKNSYDMPVHIILQGPAIYEKIITHQSAHLTLDQLAYTISAQLQWHLAYLYTFDHTYYYYLCNLKQAIVLQYQMMASHMQWHLQSLSPYKMEPLNAYKYLFGAAYRNAQFAQDMQYNRNIISYLFSHDDLNRILNLGGHTIIEQDYIPLLACCGAVIS